MTARLGGPFPRARTVCRITSIAFSVTPRGDDDPVLSGGSNEMRFFSAEELARLPFWRAHRPIRDALLGNGGELVVA